MRPDALFGVGLSAEVALFTNFFQLKIDEETIKSEETYLYWVLVHWPVHGRRRFDCSLMLVSWKPAKKQPNQKRNTDTQFWSIFGRRVLADVFILLSEN